MVWLQCKVQSYYPVTMSPVQRVRLLRQMMRRSQSTSAVFQALSLRLCCLFISASHLFFDAASGQRLKMHQGSNQISLFTPVVNNIHVTHLGIIGYTWAHAESARNSTEAARHNTSVSCTTKLYSGCIQKRKLRLTRTYTVVTKRVKRHASKALVYNGLPYWSLLRSFLISAIEKLPVFKFAGTLFQIMAAAKTVVLLP